MSLAAETRDAVRDRPFLLEALRAGVVNYAAAARTLDLDAEEDAVATALRRFADDLSPPERVGRSARVTMQSGLGPATDDPVLAVGGHGFSPDRGSLTGVLATGAVDANALGDALARCRARDVPVTAAGVADDALCVIVARRDGAAAVRLVEDALASAPR